MTEITEEQMSKLYRSSVPLSKAWLFFATQEHKEEWAELQKPSALDAFRKKMVSINDMEGDFPTKLAQMMVEPSAIMNARSDLENKLKANVLSYISKGYVLGFGHELPRFVSSVPVAVPKEAWAGNCNWDKNTLQFRGLELVDVRLTTNATRNKILERGNVDRTPPRALGRPSVAKDIMAAINALYEAGEIDPELSQKSHFPKAMRWLELNRPNLAPPASKISYETFRKQFSPFFNNLKENNKQ